MSIFVGIDNGISGSIGMIGSTGRVLFLSTPIIKQQNYTKSKKNISRVDYLALKQILKIRPESIQMVLLERPMVNPGRFMATASALRALEATLIALETLHLPYTYVDSREWQSYLLPQGTKGPAALKRASMEVGCRLWPSRANRIRKHKDADGLLIAEHCRRVFSSNALGSSIKADRPGPRRRA